jgi:hypothetical protein
LFYVCFARNIIDDRIVSLVVGFELRKSSELLLLPDSGQAAHLLELVHQGRGVFETFLVGTV